jgi:hypothetical protein
MRNCSFFILFLSVSTFSFAQSIDTEMALFQKYQRYKERFYSNFIRIDWGGDGIGTYRTAVGELKTGHYEKAGYSIPASGHHPTKNRYFWPTDPNKPVNESLCNLNPELSDENGLLTWSEDTGVYLGLYLAMLSMEYRILKYDGNETRMKQTLEEIFLILQAYRRLNMTANRWIEQYLSVRSDFECKRAWQSDLSGYSGIAIRCDVPYFFWRNFHEKGIGTKKYGLLNPPATDVYGKIPENRPGYRCADEPNGVPDVMNIYAPSQLCCQMHPLCGYSESDAPLGLLSPVAPEKTAPEIHAEKYFSQDQVIGMLFGLAFVKKFVDEDAVHDSPEGRHNIIEMTKKTAQSLTASADAFYSPPCLGRPESYAGVNSCGYDWRFTKYGICAALNYICDEKICSGSFFNFSTLLVQGFILGEKPLIVNRSGANEKRRMNFSFYHMLLAIANPERIPLENSIKDGKDYAPWIEPFYALCRMQLHDIREFDMKVASKKHNFAYDQYLPIMQQMLLSYGTKGNCIPATKKSDCYNGDYPQTNIECDADFVHHREEITGNRIVEWYPYQDDYYGNGIDFMLMYNLYRLSFPHEKRPVYKGF